MAHEINFYRVLQHDTEDQIKIGGTFPSNNLDKTVEQTVEMYNKDLAWCGGFSQCGRYFKRIAIVDAETLAVVRMIYLKNEKK